MPLPAKNGILSLARAVKVVGHEPEIIELEMRVDSGVAL
jgi:hypothetical protein